jgi:putative tryptophan/tyrosine transport system substrate-binding protein
VYRDDGDSRSPVWFSATRRIGFWAWPLVRLTVITLAISVGLLLFVAVFAAEAQQLPTVPRIGVLGAQSFGPGPDNAFRDGLRQFGYVEGKNIAIEWRGTQARSDQLPELAADLVRLKVEVVVATNNPAVAAAQRATTTIPIVMVLATDPVRLGFVVSLARPAGNITGLTIQTPEIAGKRLELLKEAVPNLTRVAVLWDPTEAGRRELVKDTEVAAPRLGLQLQTLEARNGREIGAAFTAMTRERVGAVLVYGSSMLAAHRATIAELAAKSRLPTMSVAREWMDVGFVMSYGTSLNEMYRRAPYFVDKILKGAKPADLPVEQPTKFELVINAKTAKALRLTIPPSLLLRADQVLD